MAVKQLSNGNPDGWTLGQSATDKGSFFGVATVTGRQAVVTTVDSTTITTVDTTLATTIATQAQTLVAALEAHAIAINRLIADSRAQAKADNQLITKLRALGLFKAS